MAANLQAPLAPGAVLERSHVYHAEATLLSGQFEHPIKQPIERYGRVLLENTRREEFFTETIGETNIEGLISFTSGHTRVIGTKVGNKTDIFGADHAGWVTLSTAVLEEFNAVDVLTADRVVAQVSTEHPMIHGHVPKVSFLGTTFENLRIGGFPVEVELDLGICGGKPDEDRPYLHDEAFLDRVERQLASVADSEGLPQILKKQYDAKIAYISDLKRSNNGGGENGRRNGNEKVQCSLVKSIGPIPIPGVRTFGNLIFIPNFGIVALAEVEVGVGAGDGNRFGAHDSSVQPSYSNYFTLNMFDMHLGCPVTAQTQGASTKTNGQTYP